MQLLRTNRNYRLLFSASSVSNLGDGISALAFPWLATLLSRDPFAVALVAMATRLPWFLFSLPVGVWTDRFDRQRLMVQADLFRLGLTFGVIALIFSAPSLPVEGGHDHLIWLLAGAAFLLGVAEVFRDNAAQTMLPSVVDKGDLESANGQMWSAEQVMGAFVGPPLAGVLIAYAVPTPFMFDALCFGVSAWLLWCIALTKSAPAQTRRSFWTEMGEGLRWLWQAREICQLAILLGILNALYTLTLTILVLFAQDVLHLGAFWYGVLLTSGAVGGVLGGLVCPRIAARIGNRLSLLLSLVLIAIPELAIWMAHDAFVVALALGTSMFGAILWNVVTVSYRQRMIPDALLGRVNSIYRFFGWGMMPLGALAGGLVVSLAEPDLGREAALRLPFLLAGLGALLLLFYSTARLRLR